MAESDCISCVLKADVAERHPQSVAKEGERHKGALACFLALQEIEKIAEEREHSETPYDYISKRTRAFRLLAKASRSDDIYMHGFLDAMADFVYFVNTSGTPNFEKWKPDAAMTPNERVAYFAELQEDCFK